jgi:hypothetical protein
MRDPTLVLRSSMRVYTLAGEELQVKFLSDSGENAQSIDAAKLEAQEDIALAITSTAVAAD